MIPIINGVEPGLKTAEDKTLYIKYYAAKEKFK